MFHIDECASRSNLGRIAIGCPFCKNPVFGPQGIEEDGIPKLKWLCIHCKATFTSNPPYEDSGESRESFKEKIIQTLLQEGNCELVIKIFATSSKKPPMFIEEALRDLLSGV
jgi:transposase-like protein